MKTKTAIRAFEREDIPAVAGLWQRCFRRCEQPASLAVLDYFEEVFFRSPWADQSLPSLVYQDREDRIIGFIGVLPRPMRFKGRPIRAAIASQLMIDPTRKAGFAALELMRRFFAGGQDLSFSDGANDSALRVWERCGGQSSPLYSMEWTRVLRPAGLLGHRLRNHDRLGLMARMARPAGALADLALTCLPQRTYRAPRVDDAVVEEPAFSQMLLTCMEEAAAPQSLTARYDLVGLEWLLRQASQARALGDLRCRLVREKSGATVGWYIYYVKAGAVAHVLHIGARPGGGGTLLNTLFADAWRSGAVAVRGAMDPRFIIDLERQRCGFSCPGLGTLVHSRDPEIMAAVHRGDAVLTRLEGEWWLRLGIDRRMEW